MTMMEFALLERRREINRKAARKSRSRQKELANQIRKKYYEAQSANTKLVYERKCLVRERDELSTKLREHRRSCPNCTTQSSEECFDDLPDDDDDDLQQPRAGIQIQTRRSTYHKIPSSVLIASPPLSRSLSCPETSAAASLSQLQYTEDAEDNIVLSSTSDEDEDDDDEEEEDEEEVEEEEIEKYDELTNAVFSPDYFSFTDLGIAETTTSGSAVRDASSSDPMALIADESLNVFHFEDQTDFLVAIEGDEDPFSLLDDLLPSSSMQVFGRNITTTDPTTFSKPSSAAAAAGVEFTRITGFGSSQSISTATVIRELDDDATGTYCDDQQSEAIDLSKPRAKLPTTDQSSVRAATSIDAKLINEQKRVPEPSAMNANVGNIPLHVHNFIVGEK